ncbi:MAG TPA: carboxyltransferase domain-containing protein, partial [Acidimicrobiales bacterium]|nr:carboxyltransferase domain-containing protein [Acidimicrobiales bacterium]
MPAPGPPRPVRRFGDAALSVPVADAREARRLAAAIGRAAAVAGIERKDPGGRGRMGDRGSADGGGDPGDVGDPGSPNGDGPGGSPWRGLREVVGGLRSVLLVLDPAVADPTALAEQVVALPVPERDPMAPNEIRIPVVFGGPDTDEVCQLAGLRPGQLVDLLGGAVLEVAVLGFSPGFAYLSGLPEVLRGIPRRDRPRPSVPAGSLALAGGLAAIYPQDTPGGWQLIGRTDHQLFDPTTPPFALLHPGDRVRFDPVGPVDRPGVGASSRGSGRPVGHVRSSRPLLRPPEGIPTALVVEDPGLLSLVQDGGRRGLAHLGVPAGGPADPLAHALANRLVGNRADAPAVEMTAAGPVLRCARSGYLAVVGARVEVILDGHPVGDRHVVPVAAGQQLVVGRITDGLRSYLAWSGGLVVPEILGSQATDLLSFLGSGPLAAGDELGAGTPSGPPADRLDRPPEGLEAGSVLLRVLPGPHPEWFPDDLFSTLADRSLVVDGSSDRIGLRLRPDRPLARRAGELESQGMVVGAVQVPPDGEPVVLGQDHATL